MDQSIAPLLVGVAANFRIDGPFESHSHSHKYMTAVTDLCRAVPVGIVAHGGEAVAEALAERLDGVVLTGGRSNVEPHHYGQDRRPESPFDAGRDCVVLPLVRACLRRGLPLFGVCRGIQEMNVAMGGSLFQQLHEVPGRADHRRERDLPPEIALRPSHRIVLTPDGVLHRLLGQREIDVNTLHGQAIDELAAPFQVEALADDGTIEAISAPDAPGFAVGVQWHAEFDAAEHPLHRALFEAFARAVRDYAARRPGHDRPRQVA